ncbi:MAG: chromate transporter [Hyphomicrobiales bacterium]
MDGSVLGRLALMFGSLSVMSIGGGSSLIPQIHLDVVGNYHWMTDAQFGDIFSIAQAAPGPSMLIVTLIGYKAAGLLGACIATVAMIVPASILMYVATRTWQKTDGAVLHDAVQTALAPLSIGLIAATAVLMAKAIDISWRSFALLTAATVVMALTKINPLILVALGASLGYLGFV